MRQAFGAAMLLLASSAAAQPGRYRAQSIPAFLNSGVRMMYAIDQAGNAVGFQTASVEVVDGRFVRTDAGFVFADGMATAVQPVAEGFSTSARSASGGVIVGSAQDGAGTFAALLSTSRPPVRVPLPGTASSALCVNASGTVVGTYTDATGRRAFIWSQADGSRDITPDGGSLATAYAINASGWVVGEFTGADSIKRAFIAAPEALGIDMNAALRPDSPWRLEQGWALNESGVAACNGSLDTPAGPVARGSLVMPDDPASPLELAPVGGFPASIVYGLNNRGEAVGLSLVSLSVASRKPTLWRDGEAIDLSTRIVNVSPAVRWNAVTGINDRGQIVGQFIPTGGGNALCVLTPLCDADFDGDGLLAPADLAAFVEGFEHPRTPLASDFNGDQFVDFFDFDAFVEAFESGRGCPVR